MNRYLIENNCICEFHSLNEEICDYLTPELKKIYPVAIVNLNNKIPMTIYAKLQNFCSVIGITDHSERINVFSDLIKESFINKEENYVKILNKIKELYSSDHYIPIGDISNLFLHSKLNYIKFFETFIAIRLPEYKILYQFVTFPHKLHSVDSLIFHTFEVGTSEEADKKRLLMSYISRINKTFKKLIGFPIICSLTKGTYIFYTNSSENTQKISLSFKEDDLDFLRDFYFNLQKKINLFCRKKLKEGSNGKNKKIFFQEWEKEKEYSFLRLKKLLSLIKIIK